jgi:hypothetical protein
VVDQLQDGERALLHSGLQLVYASIRGAQVTQRDPLSSLSARNTCSVQLAAEHIHTPARECSTAFGSFSLPLLNVVRQLELCQRFAAPSTTPTILYRFEKYVNQSSRTFFSLSGRSAHSGETSSAFVLVFPRARDAS